MSISRFLCELRTTIETVTVACRATGSAGTTDAYEFPYGNGFSSRLFDALAVEIDTFITDIYIAWSCCESVDLVLAFTTEGTLREGAPLLFIVLPHRSSAFLPCSIALSPRKCLPSNGETFYILNSCSVMGETGCCSILSQGR